MQKRHTQKIQINKCLPGNNNISHKRINYLANFKSHSRAGLSLAWAGLGGCGGRDSTAIAQGGEGGRRGRRRWGEREEEEEEIGKEGRGGSVAHTEEGK